MWCMGAPGRQCLFASFVVSRSSRGPRRPPEHQHTSRTRSKNTTINVSLVGYQRVVAAKPVVAEMHHACNQRLVHGNTSA